MRIIFYCFIASKVSKMQNDRYSCVLQTNNQKINVKIEKGVSICPDTIRVIRLHTLMTCDNSFFVTMQTGCHFRCLKTSFAY